MKQTYILFITAVSLLNFNAAINAAGSMYDPQPTLLENIGTCVKTPVIIAGGIGLLYATPIATKLAFTGLHAAFTACNTFTKEKCYQLGLDSSIPFLNSYQYIIDGLENDILVGVTSLYAMPITLVVYALLISKI